MSTLTEGQVEIPWTDDDIRYLKPTLLAMKEISRQYGGMMQALGAVSRLQFEAYVFIVRHGLGLKEKEAKDLDETVYRIGLPRLMAPLINYLNVLSNGGRPPKADEAPRAGEAGAALN